MATTNLVSKTLGDVLVQSGTGTPDHAASRGSYYTNVSTGTIFINTNGSTGWDSLNRVSFGDVYIQNNATLTTIGSNTTWFTLTGLTWTVGLNNGISVATNGVMTVATGRGGRYNVVLTSTIAYSTAAATIEVGISKNGVAPATGYYQGSTLSAEVATQGLSSTNYIDLVDGDTIQAAIRVPPGFTAANAILKHGGITLTRIGD